MVTLTVNGKQVQGPEERKLLPFLREELRLTSVKDGCNSGACGACTVLIDGKATRACTQPLAKLAGKCVTTVEGLSEREKEVFAYAFAECGAVQCGFCIPGMVISGKGLIDQNPSPAPADVKKALRGNICRCTGYAKIEEGILLAAKMLREGSPIPEEHHSGKLGDNYPRLDARAKTLGTGIYVDDIVVDGMLYASALRSAHPRARVLKIHKEAALAHPSCVAVLTEKDVPGNNKIGHLEFVSDYDVMIAEGDITRFLGDAVALVVCKGKEALDEVKALVKVDYEVLPAMTSPAEALAPDAPKIHEKGNILSSEHLIRGDADKALANSKFVVSHHYSVPFIEHAFMEPECAIAVPDGDDALLLYTGSQGIFEEQREISRMLGIGREKVRIQGQLVGGGFGGKEDMSVQHHAALAAWCLKQPVKVLFSREESLLVHPKRHAMEMDFTTGCDENGYLTGMRAVIISDTGAYASLGGPVLQRACTHAAGPYNYHNIDIDGKAVYTNNPPAGAFRGFGVSQSAFATESNLNELAGLVGISPWEIRYRNAIRPGQELPNGQLAGDDVELEACLLAVKEAYESAKCAGISSYHKNSGLGVAVPDTGRCILSVEKGIVHLRTSACCIGQGIATVALQIACEVTGLAPEKILVEAPDTHRTPNSGITTASRQTVFTGEATRRAAEELKAALGAQGGSLAALEGKEFFGEYLGKTDPMNTEKEHPISHVAYGYAAEVVSLNEEGKVDKIVAAYDLGQVVNPKAAEGQIEGGIVMGLGYALTEDFPLANGKPMVKYGTLGLLRATDIPPMEIQIVKPKKPAELALGTKGVGELATIPTAPAVCGAYYAKDGVLRTKLPLSGTPYSKA